MDYEELKHSDLGKTFATLFADTDVELYHHGVKGMKWGVRRYQNSDGSLTGAGRKRYKSLKQRVSKSFTKAKLKAEKRKVEKTAAKATSSKSKRIEDMSDEELKRIVNRLNMEKQYIEYMNSISQSKKTAGQKFAEGFTNKVLAPAAIEVGKKVVTNMLNSAIDAATNKKK